MSVEPYLHLKRRKDKVEVITLPTDGKGYYRTYRSKDWAVVRYVKSGRKGYIKVSDIECDFVVIGKVNPDARWTHNPREMFPDGTAHAESAAALEDLRERDIANKRKEIMTKVLYPYHPISANAQARLDEAIHMILSGV